MRCGWPLQKKKGADKRKSILELFREELRRSQEIRKERHGHRSKGGGGEKEKERGAEEGDDLSLELPPILPDPVAAEDFKLEELGKGSFDTGDPLTTNLYVGNINPKVSQ